MAHGMDCPLGVSCERCFAPSARAQLLQGGLQSGPRLYHDRCSFAGTIHVCTYIYMYMHIHVHVYIQTYMGLKGVTIL